ncbi:helix-turn-helix transcriptional regulator [Paenibacillus periandrae]|uniref:helix-turn-helix transcriptional regulator n=1 Tax=Paenibacillus periandrae TaxID=1761741 RepID=UPI001F0953D9|nr:helix-turn-helix domain-containing protein [Paenibacillus periandrae]
MSVADQIFESLVEAATAEAVRRVLSQVQTQIKPDRTLNTQEAADYIGVSRKTIYVMCAEKQIPHIPAGSIRSNKPVYLFRQSTLDAWMLEREQASCPDLK